MFSRPRVPHVRRSTAILVLAVAALAFPLGVLATHQFSDVPTGASYHDDVEALVDHGITSGCGGGQYCPSDPVTRGNMAQFLNRLGNLDGNTAPSVDADMVDGYGATDLTRAALGVMTNTLLTSSYQTIGTVTITAPVAGFVVVNASTTVYNFAAGCPCEITVGWSTTDDTFPDAWSNTRIVQGSTDIATIAVPHIYPVAAGTHTFYVVAINHAGTGTPNTTFGNAVAQFTPFGGTGAGPSLAAPAPAGTTTDTRLSD